jgi:hypothetical protein
MVNSLPTVASIAESLFSAARAGGPTNRPATATAMTELESKQRQIAEMRWRFMVV